MLDISSIKNSIKSLEKSVNDYKRYTQSNDDITDTLRAGVIQNFEVTYELCWKFMKRWLELNISKDIVMGVTRKEFYRIARENGLIDNIEVWWKFHNARNSTSHVYDEEIADDVLDTALEFVDYAKEFYNTITKKI